MDEFDPKNKAKGCLMDALINKTGAVIIIALTFICCIGVVFTGGN